MVCVWHFLQVCTLKRTKNYSSFPICHQNIFSSIKFKTLFFAIEMQWNFDIKFSFCTYMYIHEDVYSNKMVDYCVFHYDLVYQIVGLLLKGNYVFYPCNTLKALRKWDVSHFVEICFYSKSLEEAFIYLQTRCSLIILKLLHISCFNILKHSYTFSVNHLLDLRETLYKGTMQFTLQLFIHMWT